MSSDTLQSAIASIRSGDKDTGKLLLAEVIRGDPRNETAWLWMSAVIDTHKHAVSAWGLADLGLPCDL